MCLGYPAKIMETDGREALVEYKGIETKISVELIEDPSPGDFVMIHAGIAISKMKKSEAREVISALREIERLKDEAL